MPALTALATFFMMGVSIPATLQSVPAPSVQDVQAVEDLDPAPPAELEAPTESTAIEAALDETDLTEPPKSDVPAIQAIEETVLETTDIAVPETQTEASAPQPVLEPELETEPEAQARPPELTTLPALETAISEADLAAERARLLNQASAALVSAKTAKGRFEQYNPDGSFMTGTFALRRPGRMRFDYDDPVPVIVVADGTNVTQADTELPEYNTVPLGATPLRILLDDDLSFEEDNIDIINVSEDLGLVSITVQDATGELDGELTLLFRSETFDFLGWIATDSELQTRQVSLQQVETNTSIDPRLFRLDDPRDEEDER